MFDVDALLGRASLKDRIEELEEENERLQARYEAESDRRADATTARQEAERRINRLEDRIAQLEGELERRREDETGLEYRRRERIRGGELADIVDRLASVRTGAEGALTAVVDDAGVDALGVDLEGVLGERVALLEDAAPCVCCVDDAGLIAVALDPPVRPGLEPIWDDRFALEREWFLPTGRYVLALVRADLFAVGVYEGGDRVDYRGFESDVKGSHSKGGFSQARFERIRDDQIDDHLDRCADALEESLDDEPSTPLYLAGQRGVLETLTDESGLEPAATAAVDATGNPKPALEDAHHAFWTTDLRVL
ncbi:Vms1/Ankzf1 family peptidyl-tRNA hydrolase [Natrarchaeobaculum sulfurireducens]|uniref:Peptide chain release factor n=1 Tax=Natrarchaeobaculum sulfurireducens TaxID=2044521 RepID=A0A346PUK3_9EURY|nr:Vms1/Ankzf1 family peptidyl-tRNA hydrolase [Natrarchaeobaculum sulfurireducens]AXR79428.1 Peptide chain release factor eRF1 [Natrarchaeobaculum sulfurireducens]AXR83198.1 Peptide chain release factor [Natrarchaeobaculum sulfurireducens]